MSMVAPNADDINILETGVLFPFKIEETWKFLCLLIEKHQPHFLQLQQVHATTDNVHQGLFSFHKPIFSSPSSNCRAMWLRSCCVRGKGFSYYWLHLAGHSYYFLPLVTICSLHLGPSYFLALWLLFPYMQHMGKRHLHISSLHCPSIILSLDGIPCVTPIEKYFSFC